MSEWVTPVIDTASIFGLVLGDGLLIWRCYNLWNRSFRIISVPVVLTFTEAVLMLVKVIGGTVVPQNVDFQTLQNRFNDIYSAAIVIASLTTILTTTLIAYRIQSFLKLEDMSTRRFRHIIDVVVQSGVVYSLSLLAVGISTILIRNGDGLNVPLFNFYTWTNILAFPLAGISTTVMVARVATLTDDTNPTASVHMTGIQFRPRSTARTELRTRDEGASIRESPIERDLVDGKVQGSNAKEKNFQDV